MHKRDQEQTSTVASTAEVELQTVASGVGIRRRRSDYESRGCWAVCLADFLISLILSPYTSTILSEELMVQSPLPPGERETDPDDIKSTVDGMPFIELTTGYIKSQQMDIGCDDDDQEWRKCMDVCGTAKEAQDSIM